MEYWRIKTLTENWLIQKAKLFHFRWRQISFWLDISISWTLWKFCCTICYDNIIERMEYLRWNVHTRVQWWYALFLYSRTLSRKRIESNQKVDSNEKCPYPLNLKQFSWWCILFLCWFWSSIKCTKHFLKRSEKVKVRFCFPEIGYRFWTLCETHFGL